MQQIEQEIPLYNASHAHNTTPEKGQSEERKVVQRQSKASKVVKNKFSSGNPTAQQKFTRM